MSLYKGTKVVCGNCTILKSRWQHGLGLMFRRPLVDSCYIFEFGRPVRDMVHMFFMRFPIDIIWLDDRGVVCGVYKNARPYQRPIRFPCRSPVMIECMSGVIDSYNIRVGDTLRY